MLYFIFIVYSFLAGILSFLLFGDQFFAVIIFLIFSELFVYFLYILSKRIWSLKDRLLFTIFYFLGYFVIPLLYNNYAYDDTLLVYNT